MGVQEFLSSALAPVVIPLCAFLLCLPAAKSRKRPFLVSLLVVTLAVIVTLSAFRGWLRYGDPFNDTETMESETADGETSERETPSDTRTPEVGAPSDTQTPESDADAPLDEETAPEERAAFPYSRRVTFWAVFVALLCAAGILILTFHLYLRDVLKDSPGRVCLCWLLLLAGALAAFLIVCRYTTVYIAPEPDPDAEIETSDEGVETVETIDEGETVEEEETNEEEPETPSLMGTLYEAGRRDDIEPDTLVVTVRAANADAGERYAFIRTAIQKTANGAEILVTYTNYDGANEPRYTIKLTLDGDLSPGTRYEKSDGNPVRIDFSRRGDKYRTDSGGGKGNRYEFALTYRSEDWDRYQGQFGAVVRQRFLFWDHGEAYYLENGVFDFKIPPDGGSQVKVRVPEYVPVDSFLLERSNSAYTNPNYMSPFFYRYDSDLIDPKELQEAGYTVAEVQFFINEMYARHACDFHIDAMNRAFTAKTWYQEVTGRTSVNPDRTKNVTEALFNDYERRNQEVLANYRNARRELENG